MGSRFVGLLLDSWAVTFVFYGAALAAVLACTIIGLTEDQFLPIVGPTAVLAVLAYWQVPTVLRGRTLGKTIAGTQVVDIRTGEPPRWGWALLRLLVLHACWFVIVPLLISALFALRSPHQRTWWDMAGRTRVITYVPPQR